MSLQSGLESLRLLDAIAKGLNMNYSGTTDPTILQAEKTGLARFCDEINRRSDRRDEDAYEDEQSDLATEMRYEKDVKDE